MEIKSDRMIEPAQVTVYGRPGCPMVSPVLHVLESVAADYEYVDINQDWEARERVQTINRGNLSVPTLEFSDGTTLTEPGISALRTKLSEQGYDTESLSGTSASIGYILRNRTYLLLLLVFLIIILATIFRG